MNTWTRKELKARGKALFTPNYWNCVLAALVLTLIGGGSAASSRTSSSEVSSEGMDALLSSPAVLIGVFVGVVLALVVAILLAIFVFNPLKVGAYKFFVENHFAPATLREIGYGFRSNFKNIGVVLFLQELFIGLWTLLFIIPGVIKAYEYRMVPYILADNPDMKWAEARDLSKQMMDGQKMNTFLLDLSFIGWAILAVITGGIVQIFYVGPYTNSTYAELYHTLKGTDAQVDSFADFQTSF